MNLDHHLARMSPPHPALALLAARSDMLTVVMGDKRDAANLHRRWAKEKDADADATGAYADRRIARVKDLEADVCRRRINHLSIVRARILRSAS